MNLPIGVVAVLQPAIPENGVPRQIHKKTGVRSAL